jgi:hypothetical protein
MSDMSKRSIQYVVLLVECNAVQYEESLSTAIVRTATMKSPHIHSVWLDLSTKASIRFYTFAVSALLQKGLL